MRDDNIYSVYLYTTVVCCNYSRTDKWISILPQYPHRIWTGDASGEPGHPSHLGLSLSLSCRRIHVDYNSRISPLLFYFLFFNSFFLLSCNFLSLSIYHRMIIEWLHGSWTKNPAIRACTPTASVPNPGVVCTERHFPQEPPALISELLEFESWISQFTILFSFQYDVPREGQAGVPLL